MGYMRKDAEDNYSNALSTNTDTKDHGTIYTSIIVLLSIIGILFIALIW